MTPFWPFGSVWRTEPIAWRVDEIVAATADVIDLATVRDGALRVTNGTAEDTIVQLYLDAAVAIAERATQRTLAPRTLELVLDRFPCDRSIQLPRPPLLEVTSVIYLDSDGVSTTLSTDDYTVSLPTGPTASPGRITLASGRVWPVTQCLAADAVRIRYRSGYSDGASPEGANVPTPIKQGILLLVGEFYKQRSESVSGLSVSAAAQIRADALFARYRVF